MENKNFSLDRGELKSDQFGEYIEIDPKNLQVGDLTRGFLGIPYKVLEINLDTKKVWCEVLGNYAAFQKGEKIECQFQDKAKINVYESVDENE